ncbi:MAG: hypothetical protein E7393_00820 [Ruminococcaceae bacterium]|nr:hypothetical protein [Oscillospiraceae bacterium]
MDFISEYVITIMTVSVLAVLLENILPEDNNKKYIHVIIGLLVMLVILAPLTNLPHYSDTFSFPALRLENTDVSVLPHTSYVSNTFQKNLELSLCQDLYERYGLTVDCRVALQLNDNGQIAEIRKIQLIPYNTEMALYVSEKYGIQEDIISP